MLDLLFAVAFIALPIAAFVLLRGSAAFSVLAAVTIGASGVFMQFIAVTFHAFRLRELQMWLVVTLVALVILAAWARVRDARPASRSAVLVTLGSSALVAVTFLSARLLAPGNPGPLSGVGWLIERESAEDNAKWLNATAELAAGVPVQSSAAVGGPLLLLLVFSATLVSVASTVLYGGVNQVAVAADTLILSEILLVVIAPFALAPIIQARIVWRTSGDRVRTSIPWPLATLSVGALVAAAALLLNYGHLTLQFTLLSLTLWVATFLAPVRGIASRTIATFAVVTTAEVWFPLNFLAGFALLALAALGVWGLVRDSVGRRRYSLAVLVGAVALFVLMADFLWSSITYVLGSGTPTAAAFGSTARGVSAVNVPSLPLFAQPGGTEVISSLMAILTVASVIGAVAFLRRDELPSRRTVLPFIPIFALASYAMVISIADFWSIGSGPNYASQKMVFAVSIPILVSTLPLAILYAGGRERGMTVLRWSVLVGVVGLLVLDTFIPRAVIQLKPGLWPSASGEPQPYWWPAEVRATGDQPLASNPIGCVYLPQGSERPGVLQDGRLAYACTRILSGLVGADTAAAGLVKWQLDEWLQNESIWNTYQPYLTQLSPEVKARTLILLDDNSEVVGIASLQSLLDRYPPVVPPESAS